MIRARPFVQQGEICVSRGPVCAGAAQPAMMLSSAVMSHQSWQAPLPAMPQLGCIGLLIKLVNSVFLGARLNTYLRANPSLYWSPAYHGQSKHKQKRWKDDQYSPHETTPTMCSLLATPNQ